MHAREERRLQARPGIFSFSSSPADASYPTGGVAPSRAPNLTQFSLMCLPEASPGGGTIRKPRPLELNLPPRA